MACSPHGGSRCVYGAMMVQGNQGVAWLPGSSVGFVGLLRRWASICACYLHIARKYVVVLSCVFSSFFDQPRPAISMRSCGCCNQKSHVAVEGRSARAHLLKLMFGAAARPAANIWHRCGWLSGCMVGVALCVLPLHCLQVFRCTVACSTFLVRQVCVILCCSQIITSRTQQKA